MNAEELLDRQIDALLQERKPQAPVDRDGADLLAVVRSVKRLRPQAAPSPRYGESVAGERERRFRFRRVVPGLIGAVAVAAALILGVLAIPALRSENIVYAMEKAVAALSSYHAVIEHYWVDPATGQMNSFSREEFWVQGDRYHAVMRDGTLVISDGDREWWVEPERKVARHGYPVGSDLHEFSPASLARKVADQPYAIDGEEIVAGRPTVRVTVTPEDGFDYRIWIDKETKLPLQYKQVKGPGHLYTMVYKTFDLNPAIDPARFTYQPPADFQVVDGGKRTASVAEAAEIAGFQPVVPQERPKRIIADKGLIEFDFGDARMTQSPAADESVVMHPAATYGWAQGGPVQVMGTEMLRFQYKGLTVHVHGSRQTDRAVAIARQIIPDLSMPLPETGPRPNRNAKVDVLVDMEQAIALEKAYEKDPAAHQGRVAPAAVAVRFLAEEHGHAVAESALVESANIGTEIVYDVSDGPVAKVYLRRAARNDAKGLWWVIGYDPR